MDELKNLNLKSIYFQYKYEISFTLFLVVLENILYLLFPLFLGFAINDLLKGNIFWLIILTALGLGDMLTSAIRKHYDTRLYGRIYQEISPHVVEKEHTRNSGLSKISARVSMLEELIDFFEDIIPEVIGTLISLIGTLLIIYFLRIDVFILSLLVLFFIITIYRITRKKTLRLNRELNDIQETQIDIIKLNKKVHTKKFAKKLMGSYIEISDMEMSNFALSFTLIILLISTSLYLIIKSGIVDYGLIFSIILYLFNFLEDVTELPIFYQNYIRLSEIIHRLK